jgi:pimeloyl-ACP methyl ester carboxylesterase
MMKKFYSIPTRRDVLIAGASGLLAGSVPSIVQASNEETIMAGMRPFHVNYPEADLAGLHARISATRWPDRETVKDDTEGVQLATAQALVGYWKSRYNWRNVEARINALPNYKTEIDGLDIHFIHVRSKHKNALPLIVTHGWPGSIIEQMKIIDPLTNPTAHGASAADAFDIVIPSLPGYGFSAKPAATGWDPPRVARAWIELMRRLGYTRYVAQGGDWGNAVTELMAKQTPPGLLGIHTNMPAALQPDISKGVQTNQPPPAGLSSDELHAYNQLLDFFANHTAYAAEMSKRPQTLYGVADSPVALAAWMLDHDKASYELIARAFAGTPGGLSQEDILENVTLYWLTNTGISSARLYWENKGAFFDVRGITIPVAVSAFPDELYQCPRSWAQAAYSKLIYYNKLDRGGHFAAWEQPQIFSAELRAAFKPLR